MSPLVLAIAQAIAKEEGFYTAGSIAQRNNNPGNLRSWGSAPIVSGYASAPDVATGWSWLYSQIQTNIGRGLTLNEFFAGKPGVYAGYSPSADGNQPAAYAAFVGAQAGIPVDVPLNQIDPTTLASSAAAPAIDPTTGLPIDTSLTDYTNSITSDPSQSGSVDYTLLLIVGAAFFALWYFSD